MKRKHISVVSKAAVPTGTRIFGSKWVDSMKKIYKKSQEKYRLIAQNYSDKNSPGISTKSTTITRLGQIIETVNSYLLPRNISYVRGVSKSYLQSTTFRERPAYLEPPQELGNCKVIFFKRPLYGIP